MKVTVVKMEEEMLALHFLSLRLLELHRAQVLLHGLCIQLDGARRAALHAGLARHATEEEGT